MNRISSSDPYSPWRLTTCTTATPPSILEVVMGQTPVAGGWICPTCKHYEGGVGCEAGVFIAFVGAGLAGCQLYERGRPCNHCGRAT